MAKAMKDYSEPCAACGKRICKGQQYQRPQRYLKHGENPRVKHMNRGMITELVHDDCFEKWMVMNDLAWADE